MFIVNLFFTLTGCVSGNDVPTEKTDYSIILNRGSMFVYAFKDPVTNVWYISGRYGVTPRLNQDGSLYVNSKKQREN
jgi:hypothetical protein